MNSKVQQERNEIRLDDLEIRAQALERSVRHAAWMRGALAVVIILHTLVNH